MEFLVRHLIQYRAHTQNLYEAEFTYKFLQAKVCAHNPDCRGFPLISAWQIFAFV